MHRLCGAAVLIIGVAIASPIEAQVTYSRDVAPILAEHCASCHHPGAIAPFSLLTFEDVRPHARDIARATASRQMPPWKPEPGYGDFIDARRLSDRDIATIRQWADQGFRRGDAADLPAPREWASGWQAGTPDLVLSMPEAYTLPAGTGDVFRSFVIPISTTNRRYVKAVEFRPDNFTVVHHANIKIDPTRASRRWDDNEPGPGYEGGGSRNALFPDGHFLGWTPGQSRRVWPEEMAWRLEPASDLVVELHLMRQKTSQPLRVSVGLFFTDHPPSRTPYMLRLGRQNIDIAAGDGSYESADTYVLPVDVRVLAVQPHAHYRAREIHATATLPDGTTRELLYIKDWDFHWQDAYTYRAPVELPRGTTIAMRYLYDNSNRNRKNPDRPPRRIRFGQTSSSEMGDLWIQVLPATAADRDTLDRDFLPKMLRDDIAGNETWLEVEPRNASLHAELAACYMEAGRPDAAIAHLREAARLDPTPGRQYDLGLALVTQRSFEDARAAFDRALSVRPQFPEAVFNLGVIAHAQDRADEAIAHYMRARAMGLDDSNVHYNLGRALADKGRHQDAAEEYRQAMAVNPEDAEIHRALGEALSRQGDSTASIAEYRRALALAPDTPIALVQLAWILARRDGSSARDREEAVRLAERAVTVTKHRDPLSLDALAAAYMAANQVERGIAAAEEALALAASSGDDVLAQELRLRLQAYRPAK